MSVSMQAISLGVHWLLSRFPTMCAFGDTTWARAFRCDLNINYEMMLFA